MSWFTKIKDKIKSFFSKKPSDKKKSSKGSSSGNDFLDDLEGTDLRLPTQTTSNNNPFDLSVFKNTLGVRDETPKASKKDSLNDLGDIEKNIARDIKPIREETILESITPKDEGEKNRIEELINKAKEGKMARKNALEKSKELRSLLRKQQIGDMNEIWTKYAPQERVQSGFYSTEEELKNGKFDLYRNVIMGALDDDKVAKQIFESGVIQKNMVANIIMDVSIINNRNVEIGRRTVNYEVEGLTPEMAEDKGLFRFYTAGRGSFTMKSILYTLDHEFGVKNIQAVKYQIGDGNTSDDVRLVVNRIMVRFDYASGK